MHGDKVDCLKITWIKLLKSEPKKMFYKHNYSEDSVFEEVDLSKKREGVPMGITLLSTKSYYILKEKQLSTVEKKKDLISLLELIPPSCHSTFYTGLKTSNDDGLDICEDDTEN